MCGKRIVGMRRGEGGRDERVDDGMNERRRIGNLTFGWG